MLVQTHTHTQRTERTERTRTGMNTDVDIEALFGACDYAEESEDEREESAKGTQPQRDAKSASNGKKVVTQAKPARQKDYERYGVVIGASNRKYVKK